MHGMLSGSLLAKRDTILESGDRGMQAKHRYIWIFGGICVAYLLIMVLVGRVLIQEPDAVSEEEVFLASVHHPAGEDSKERGTIRAVEPLEESEDAADTVQEGGEQVDSGNKTGATQADFGDVSETGHVRAEEVPKTVPADPDEKKVEQKAKQKTKAAKNPVFYGYRHISRERKKVVRLAKKYVGKISYFWGGKPSGEDIKGKTDPNSLDCSGFIQFIWSKALGKRINSVGATVSISTLRKISKAELKPGDIGLKLGTGSLYFDADGKSYTEPGLAENANEQRIKTAKKKIFDLQGKIDLIGSSIQEKKEKINILKEKRQNLLEKADRYGEVRVSKSKKTFFIVDAEDEDAEERLEDYKERYESIGERIENCQSMIARYVAKRSECRSKIQTQRNVVKKYDVEVRDQIDHVGLYCGKDKEGREIWCHCSSSEHGVVWQNTNLFRYYYRYFE